MFLAGLAGGAGAEPEQEPPGGAGSAARMRSGLSPPPAAPRGVPCTFEHFDFPACMHPSPLPAQRCSGVKPLLFRKLMGSAALGLPHCSGTSAQRGAAQAAARKNAQPRKCPLVTNRWLSGSCKNTSVTFAKLAPTMKGEIKKIALSSEPWM